MRTLIGRSRYLSLVAVITLLLAFVVALLWGVAKAVLAGYEIAATFGQSPSASLYLIKVVDAFLIAVVLYILAASIYSLFVDAPGVPEGLVAHDLSELKSKLSGVIVLVLAVRFAEILFEGILPPLDVLWLGLATAAVGGTLTAFGWIGSRATAGRMPKT